MRDDDLLYLPSKLLRPFRGRSRTWRAYERI